MATKKKTTMQKLAVSAAADAMLRRPMEPTLTLVQPTTIEALTSPVNDVGGEADPFDAQLAEENGISAACYDALLAEKKTARPPMPTTTDPASSMTQAEIETKAATAKPKATSAHAFAIITAYGIALSAKRSTLGAMREVVDSFPAGIRRSAVEMACRKEMPGSACNEALKTLASEQPASERATSTSATMVGTKRRKVVAIRDGESHGFWITATAEMTAAKFIDVTVAANGSITIVAAKA